MKPTPTDARTQLIREIRAGFILRGTTLAAWSREQGMDASLVRQAIYGTWAGPKGRAVKANVLRAAGVKEVA